MLKKTLSKQSSVYIMPQKMGVNFMNEIVMKNEEIISISLNLTPDGRKLWDFACAMSFSSCKIPAKALAEYMDIPNDREKIWDTLKNVTRENNEILLINEEGKIRRRICWVEAMSLSKRKCILKFTRELKDYLPSIEKLTTVYIPPESK